MAGSDASTERRTGRPEQADRRTAGQRTFAIACCGEPDLALSMMGAGAIVKGWLPVDAGADLVLVDGRAGASPEPPVSDAYRLLVVGADDDPARAIASGLADDAVVVGDQRGLGLRLAVAARVIDGRRRAAGLIGQARRWSEEDPLTGLGNRRALSVELDALLRRARAGVPGALLLLDLDHYKRINDRYGHLVGDQVLRQVALAIADALRDDADGAFRWGGDELVVLLPGADERSALEVADRLRRGIGQLTVGGHGDEPDARITVSIGLVAIPAGRVATWVDALRAADQGLYAAKAMGRDRVCVGALPAATEPSPEGA